MAIWYFSPFDIFYGYLVYFEVIFYISPRFGILYQEKSGNPVAGSRIPKKHNTPRYLISEVEDGKVLLVLGDVGELALGVDAADDAVDEARVLHCRVA
jgi:hypothetical protein